uniref:Uncharacterized protein n=1 Tax=Pipistrellus kuhlii TaxID=59472 RepID=A0A7J7TKL1_PIPKU|nr:hypothetical protein mPipKuh1_009332 [Pipistrellus kuhlii]
MNENLEEQSMAEHKFHDPAPKKKKRWIGAKAILKFIRRKKGSSREQAEPSELNTSQPLQSQPEPLEATSRCSKRTEEQDACRGHEGKGSRPGSLESRRDAASDRSPGGLKALGACVSYPSSEPEFLQLPDGDSAGSSGPSWSEDTGALCVRGWRETKALVWSSWSDACFSVCSLPHAHLGCLDTGWTRGSGSGSLGWGPLRIGITVCGKPQDKIQRTPGPFQPQRDQSSLAVGVGCGI